jgi:hypothetical protein
MEDHVMKTIHHLSSLGRSPIPMASQHVTIRVPWHDSGWAGQVCKDPRANTSCLVLSRIGTTKRDAVEEQSAGRKFDKLEPRELPPCAEERGGFMASFSWTRVHHHPYVESSPKTHGHFAPTPFRHDPCSAACVPYRWMLRAQVEDGRENERGLASQLMIPFDARHEPELPFKTAWVQSIENQSALLEAFFGALEPQTSLCFFYAKRTPLSEDHRRVIIGVGRVVGVGEPVEYEYATKAPPLRGMLWERNVRHSIRPTLEDGFLFPYAEVRAAAAQNPSIDVSACVAFAPDEYFDSYSYGSEHLANDGAIASLVACAAALEKIEGVVPGPWAKVRTWIDGELNRLWKARGPFPGLGAALTAFGLEHGNLIAHFINRAQVSEKREWTESPWALVDAIFEDPGLLPGGLGKAIGKTFRDKWKKLPKDRRALLELVARGALSDAQALRAFQPTEREKAKIVATDKELLTNPYQLYELDRTQGDPISFPVVDRAMFPDPVVREAFPLPEPSLVEEAIDARRVRAAAVHILEQAREEGHTLLPRGWVIQRVRDASLSPACPLDEDTLAVTEGSFAPLLRSIETHGSGKAYQLDELASAGALIRDAIHKRVRPPRHVLSEDWRRLVDQALDDQPLPTDPDERRAEERARTEKAAALEEIACARAAVLIGSAGTGKSTLLRALCAIPAVRDGGVLLLAPTGKARVRLEIATHRPGEGRTLAQFLNALGRFDGKTGRYLIDAKGKRAQGASTVIIDECSMLTEEQLAALLSALPPKYDRLVLVGDPRQLPPIGAGRPFVDIVQHLAPADVETRFPRCGTGYAELTTPRRQEKDRDDVLVASHFSGQPLDPGADQVWARLSRGEARGVEVVPWKDAAELESRLIQKLVESLGLASPDDEQGFERSIGGTDFKGHVFFWPKKGDNPGAASKAEDWQILSPVRGDLVGVEALNRAIQARFRKRARERATERGWGRKIPPPMGPQAILWGDKVINVVNSGRRRVYPARSDAYVANGDLGVVVGEYKTSSFPGMPSNLDVELATQLGSSYKYWASELGDADGVPPLELAYALTVHKTQGSEFKTTFVVLPSPCRLLSRELLYTALTRQRDKLVLFPQGDLADLRRYADPLESEVARRVTNLFSAPRLVAVPVVRKDGTKHERFLEATLIHRTERGDLVRSKSEVIIADKLHARGIDYQYEAPLELDGSRRYPDFTIDDSDAGRTFYWEHLGLLDDPSYEARWRVKLAAYERAGILPAERAKDATKVLIVTRDAPGGAIDAAEIARLIDTLLQP